MSNNLKTVVYVLIVLAVVAVLVFITIKGKNNMNENQAAKLGDTVSVTYTGKLADGTVFDSNVGKEEFSFVLGAHNVIPGFENGILGMKVGEKKTLVIPPEEGYGPNDYGPIPGNSILTFEVEVLNFADKIIQSVFLKFGLKISPEVNFI